MLQLLNTPTAPLYWFKLTGSRWYKNRKRDFPEVYFKHFEKNKIYFENNFKTKTRINVKLQEILEVSTFSIKSI